MSIKKKNRQLLLRKNGKKYSVQIWVQELKSWLVFDNFKNKRLVQRFIKDEDETLEREAFITRMVKKQNEEKKKKANISNAKDIKKIKR